MIHALNASQFHMNAKWIVRERIFTAKRSNLFHFNKNSRWIYCFFLMWKFQLKFLLFILFEEIVGVKKCLEGFRWIVIIVKAHRYCRVSMQNEQQKKKKLWFRWTPKPTTRKSMKFVERDVAELLFRVLSASKSFIHLEALFSFLLCSFQVQCVFGLAGAWRILVKDSELFAPVSPCSVYRKFI